MLDKTLFLVYGIPESTQMPPIAKFVLIGIILITAFFMILAFRLRKKITKDIEEKNINKLATSINQRVSSEGISDDDIFNSKIIYETRLRVTRSKLNWSLFGDLFSDLDKKKVGAITEMRYKLDKLTFNGLKELYGFSITRTKNDWLTTEMKNGLMYVSLNNKPGGIIDFENKRILQGKSVVGRLDFPEIYIKGLNTIKFDVSFNDEKSASVIASQNFIRSYLQLIPNLRIKTAEIQGKLSKEQFALVLGIILFLKMKNSLFPGKKRLF